MPVPSNWQLDPLVDDQPIYTNMNYPFRKLPPEPPAINPTGWYRTTFDVPSDWTGREIFLWFESCDSACQVWVNGHDAGYSEDSKLPHEFNITPLIRPGRNHLAVMVPRYCDGFFLECQDYWHLSGIQRDVVLYSKPTAHIRDYIVRTHLDATYTDARLEVKLYMNPLPDLAQGYQGRIMLYDPSGQPMLPEPVTAAIALESPMYGDTQPEFTAAQFHVLVPKPQQWTPETPTLYTLVLTLVNPQGIEVDFERCRVGFRQFEIKNRQLLLNGKRLIVRGINAHEHHPEKGRNLSADDMRRDIVAMKRLNFNAIRTCHYPRHSRFYDLCDELGMLVVDEANLETHGVAAMLSKDPLWLQAYMERAQRMVLRDKNHPCIMAWSLGNESHHGPHHAAMAAWLRHYDPTRPVQYESGSPGPSISDICCPMYPTFHWMQQVFNDRNEQRPMILCEYAYAKGNGGGNFKDYWDLVDTQPSFQGGFIWDWSEKALVVEVSGRREWAYGEEFDGGIGPDGYPYGKAENPTQCLNGIVMPDLMPKPAAWEIMQVQSPVQALLGKKQNVTQGQFTLWNKYQSLDLSHLMLRWSVTEDDRVLVQGHGPMPKVAAGTKASVDLALPPIEPKPGSEYFLNVDFVLDVDTPWAEKGHVIGWHQFALPVNAPAAPRLGCATTSKLELHEADEQLMIRGDGFRVSFDRRMGVMKGYQWHDRPLITDGPRDQFYRSRTDNDYLINHTNSYHNDWLQWGLNRLQRRRVTMNWSCLSEQLAVVRVLAGLGVPEADANTLPIHCETLYYVLGSGDVVVQNQVTIAPAIAHLARIGMELRIHPTCEQLSWFGRGPYETYPDRKQSARVGWYQSTVTQQFFPFIDPCETGGKQDVRWLTLSDEQGHGLLVTGLPTVHACALHFDIADIVSAKHVYELHPTPDVVLHLDHRHMGLGGDTGWSRNVHEPFMVRPGTYSYRYRLRGLSPGDNPRNLARTTLDEFA